MLYYLTLAGWDCERAETDHLVKWVDAPSKESVQNFADKLGLSNYTIEHNGRENVEPDDGLDVSLNNETGDCYASYNCRPWDWKKEQRC